MDLFSPVSADAKTTKSKTKQNRRTSNLVINHFQSRGAFSFTQHNTDKSGFFLFFLYHPPPSSFPRATKEQKKENRNDIILNFLIFYFKSFVSLCSPLRLIVRYAIWHVPKTFRQRNSNFKMKITAAISVWFVFLLLVQTDKMHKEKKKNRDVINRDSVCMSFVLLYI